MVNEVGFRKATDHKDLLQRRGIILKLPVTLQYGFADEKIETNYVLMCYNTDIPDYARDMVAVFGCDEGGAVTGGSRPHDHILGLGLTDEQAWFDFVNSFLDLDIFGLLDRLEDTMKDTDYEAELKVNRR